MMDCHPKSTMTASALSKNKYSATTIGQTLFQSQSKDYSTSLNANNLLTFGNGGTYKKFFNQLWTVTLITNLPLMHIRN